MKYGESQIEINAKWKNKLFLIKLIKPNELF